MDFSKSLPKVLKTPLWLFGRRRRTYCSDHLLMTLLENQRNQVSAYNPEPSSFDVSMFKGNKQNNKATCELYYVNKVVNKVNIQDIRTMSIHVTLVSLLILNRFQTLS